MVWYRGTTRFIILFIFPLTSDILLLTSYIRLLPSDLNDAVVGLADVFIDGDGADAVGYDVATGGVLDIFDMSTDVRLDGGVLKDAVAGLVEGTVFEYEVLRITQQLFTGQVTVYQTDILRMPGEVFAIEIGIKNRDIFALPERVLRQDAGIMYLDILTVLEHVFRIAVQSVDKDILAEHERIGTPMEGDILQAQPIHFPKGLVSIRNVDILEFHITHFAEELRAVNTTAAHHQVVGVPDS